MADEAKFKTAMDLLESVDKPMTKSKKFVGFLLVEITWKALIAVGIWQGLSDTVLLAMIGGATAYEGVAQGTLAWHDKHIKTGKLKAMNGHASAESLLEEAPPEAAE